jgi:hypothetical protein
MLLDAEFGDASLPPMRAMQSILGINVERDRLTARVELYEKGYDELALLTRDHEVVGDGTGSSRGADVWLKWTAPLGVAARIAYSLVDAERTDASSGIVTRAPFDVTHSVTALVEKRWPMFIMTSAAYRFATGRPFTPVASATHDPGRGVWTPTYAAPMSERLPAFHRLDLSGSVLRRFGPVQSVVFYTLSNALDRENIHTYRYSPDYSERIPVRSLFNRAHYFGFSLTWS